MPFRDLGVDEVICAALDDAGIYSTFPIQALTLPLAIDGQDIIGQARTGTGKTLAFGVPILHRLATTLAAARAAASVEASRCRIGTPKARVLPVPVRACPMMSWPSMASGSVSA